jgi:protein O-mannosyl-transferase
VDAKFHGAWDASMRAVKPDLGVSLALAVATAAAFSPAVTADWVGFDDPVYVLYNRHVLGGLSRDGFFWSWGFYASNWHPLTWLSLQLDATIFGKAPAGYHAENVAIHVGNVILLFFTLRALTGATWRSGVAAALFGLHPLRVESVAWVSERKDVLSVFLGLLALRAYTGYARTRSRWVYGCVAALLTLSLLAKATLVSLPALMLVLDWWPLGRTGGCGGGDGDASGGGSDTAPPSIERHRGASCEARAARGVATWRWLVAEKVPLVVVSVVVSVLTYLAQEGGGSIQRLAVGVRLANATVAYATYLALAAWPVRLAPLYPYREHGWNEWQFQLSLAMLAGLTLLAVWQRRRRPHLLVGWLWYLGTLLPTSGVVAVGAHTYADRYTYFPSIGPCMALVWTLADLVPLSRVQQAAVLTAGVMFAMAVLTYRQSVNWKNDVTLWSHTLEVTGANAQADNNLGLALEMSGQRDTAMKYYELAVRTRPRFANALYNIGRLKQADGDDEEATVFHLKAVWGNRRLAHAYYELGRILGAVALNTAEAELFRSRLRRHLKTIPQDDPFLQSPDNGLTRILADGDAGALAQEYFLAMLRLDPDSSAGHREFGRLLGRLNQRGAAIKQFEEALRLDPEDASTHTGLGVCLATDGQLTRAAEHFRLSAQLRPTAASLRRLGSALDRLNGHEDAIDAFRRALAADAGDGLSRLGLARALERAGDSLAARTEYAEAERMDASFPQRVVEHVWSEVTRGDNGDPDYTVWSVEIACAATRPTPARHLDVLAAAYAAAGRFREATATAEAALAATDVAKNAALVDGVASRLALYQRGLAYRGAPSPTPK